LGDGTLLMDQCGYPNQTKAQMPVTEQKRQKTEMDGIGRARLTETG